MVNGETTGGAGGTEITVNNLTDLRSAVSGTSSRIVYIDGSIVGDGTDVIYLGSNKTIIGLPGSSLEGCGFGLFGVSNVIFRNLIVSKYLAVNTGIRIKESSHHVWIDHCEFFCDRIQEWGYWGKDIAITDESDCVTVSFCKLHDNHMSVLVGDGTASPTDYDRLRVTFAYNYFYNHNEREPSYYFGKGHMLNNYHLDNSGYSIGIREDGTVRTDNEVFENCNRPISTKIAESLDGYVGGVDTNLYINCGVNNITTPLSDWIPEYDYSNLLLPTSKVKEIVLSNSGVQ